MVIAGRPTDKFLHTSILSPPGEYTAVCVDRDGPLNGCHIAVELCADHGKNSVDNAGVVRGHEGANADGQEDPPFAIYAGYVPVESFLGHRLD